MERSLAGKGAIVTGVGPGIGSASALALARDGADVVVAARDADRLMRVAKDIAGETGRKVVPMPCDIKDLDACEALVRNATSELGRVDAIVNVATHSFKRSTIPDYDWSHYAESVQLNVIGTMKCCGEAAKEMMKIGGGAIVNISTLATRMYIPKNSEYASTKAAMIVASKTMAREMGEYGIRVNIVTPGYTTGVGLDGLFERMAEGAGTTAEEMSRRQASEAALLRHVDPEDIAEAVLFLASDRSRNITGVDLSVTAGNSIA